MVQCSNDDYNTSISTYTAGKHRMDNGLIFASIPLDAEKQDGGLLLMLTGILTCNMQ